MTWKEFVEMVEKEGVKPEDEIDYIDISLNRPAPLSIVIEETKNSKKEVSIWN